MPRAGVHARRDLPFAQRLFARLGVPFPREGSRLLREHHRAIDRLQDDGDADLHFMRGQEEEDAPGAVARALAQVEAHARRAADALRAARAGDGPRRLAEEALRAVAEAFHAVRDSYSRGHARRSPGPAGPAVIGLHSWENNRRGTQAFGLVHALRHDIRFEAPFARFAPEVPASDRAVAHLADLIARVVMADAPYRDRTWATGWERFVEQHVRPPGTPPAEEAEDQAPEPGQA